MYIYIERQALQMLWCTYKQHMYYFWEFDGYRTRAQAYALFFSIRNPKDPFDGLLINRSTRSRRN